MQIKRRNKRKEKVKVVLEKGNRDHERTPAKLGDGIDKEFAAKADAFSE